MSFHIFHTDEFLILRSAENVESMTLPYTFRKVKYVAGHPALILKRKATCWAIRQQQQREQEQKLLQGEKVVILHLIFVIWWRGWLPRESIYNIRVFSSNPISSPLMLKSERILEKKVKKSTPLTKFSHKKKILFPLPYANFLYVSAQIFINISNCLSDSEFLKWKNQAEYT